MHCTRTIHFKTKFLVLHNTFDAEAKFTGTEVFIIYIERWHLAVYESLRNIRHWQ